MADHDLSPRQKAYFATMRARLERETGRSLAQWAAIARTCPETRPRARLAWMKAEHGLGQNRAALVLDAAFPPTEGWAQPDALEAALWKDEAARAIFEAVREAVAALDAVTIGQRKGYTAFSRRFQFAAARPKGDGLLLGLALAPASAPGLSAASRPIWSERLAAELLLGEPAGVPAIAPLIEAAWSRS